MTQRKISFYNTSRIPIMSIIKQWQASIFVCALASAFVAGPAMADSEASLQASSGAATENSTQAQNGAATEASAKAASAAASENETHSGTQAASQTGFANNSIKDSQAPRTGPVVKTYGANRH
jgi:hypothetical protein